MTRLRALNESSSDDSEDDNEERETIEAQEERAFKQYKKALELRQQECYVEAEHMLLTLLNDDFLADVSIDDRCDESDALARPVVALKYACLKNLGNVLELQDRVEDGLKCYLQAVELDKTDVSMWYQIGKVALKIAEFHLASKAFQEGLRCNSRHWPCLDALLPILYALNDYLGCLLLVSRTLALDPQYSQALALRHQIWKEDPMLLQNFKLFFPQEYDILDVTNCVQEEEASSIISHAFALQKQYSMKNTCQSKWDVKNDLKTVKLNLPSCTWENLGQSLLQTYRSISSSPDMSYLDLVEICATEPLKSSDVMPPSLQVNETVKQVQCGPESGSAVDVETEAMDVDSEQDGKGEDQTEEDVTEASGLEQDDEAKVTCSVQQTNSSWKRKRKHSSTNLMDQWSKRRSGRRSGRKVEDRDESTLASRFRSLLPDSLLPGNLEAEIAKASRRRSTRGPVDLLALGDDSMDTEELCRLLQERDAKDEHQLKKRHSLKENFSQRICEEKYFGTDLEMTEVSAFVKEKGARTSNVIKILSEFIFKMAEKHSLTWPLCLPQLFLDLYECMRKHIPFQSPLEGSNSAEINFSTLNTSLLYCELFVDQWQQRNHTEQDILGESGLVLAGALGNVMLLSGLGHIFSSPSDQLKVMLRINWLKAHVFLLQENSPSAIFSLQDVIESLSLIESEQIKLEKDQSSQLQASDIHQQSLDEQTVVGVTCEPISSEVNLCVSQTSNPSSACTKSIPETIEENREVAEGSNLVILGGCITQSEDKSLNLEKTLSETKQKEELSSLSTSSLEGDNMVYQTVAPSDTNAMRESSETEVPLFGRFGKVQEEIADYNGNDEGSVCPEHTTLPYSSEDKKRMYLNPAVVLEKNEKTCEKLDKNEGHNMKDLKDSENYNRITKEIESFSQPGIQHQSDKENCVEDNDKLEPEKDVPAVSLSSTTTSKDKQNVDEVTVQLPSPKFCETDLPGFQCESTTFVLSSKLSNKEDLNIQKMVEKSPELKREKNSDTFKSTNLAEQAEGSSNTCTSKERFKSYLILSNCCKNQEISKRTAQKLLISLTRQKQLSEVDDLYNSGQYDLLASTLTECFKYCAQQADCDNPEIDDLPDRATQMAMLLDSLWQLQRYKDCFYWAEVCLHESFNRYLNSTDSDNSLSDHDDHQMWATTVERILAGLNSCLKVADQDVLAHLPKASLTRLVQTLTSILCQQLEHSDCSVEMAIECTTPWLILHRVIYFEEQGLLQYHDCIPSHLDVLFTAHEYMAKKARCCLNEGVLLNLILDIVVPKIKSLDINSKLVPLLNHQVEQAIFCLYGHPKKPIERSKKKLQDHKVHQQLELTWERSLPLIKFYEPDELPTFDSTGWRIGQEEEQLFLRILQLVPNDSNPSRYLGSMKSFLRGAVDTVPEVLCSFPQAAWNLYYLLADFYLKTFKWEAAAKYYLLDVCLNPVRFDSWAGMALAQGTLLCLNINSCDTFDNSLHLRQKTIAQKCFQMAVELDPENTTMWIEYGNFAYTAHSLCSRLLKTETMSLSMDMFNKLEEEKDKMLNITETCFKAAEKLDQDERWLQQYMLGKVAEKRGEGPTTFLQHYRSAAQLLYESNAEYPLTINYDPPQHYAFEAHEVHYRIHASILKHLELMEGKHISDSIEKLYLETLDEAANSPFMAVRTVTQGSLINLKRNSVDLLAKPCKKSKLEDVTVLKKEAVPDIPFVEKSAALAAPMHPTEDFIIPCNTQCNKIDDGQNIASTSSSNNENMTIAFEQTESKAFRPAVLVTKPEGQQAVRSEEQTILTRSNCVGDITSEVIVTKISPTEDRKGCMLEDEEATVLKKDQAVPDSLVALGICKESQPSYSVGSDSSSANESSDEDCNARSKSSVEHGAQLVHDRDILKGTNKVTVHQTSNKSPGCTQAPTGKSLDHMDLVSRCLSGIEECLVRYPRHYKSFYRLGHHYFQSKQHQNFRKCRMLLLGDYRVLRLNKSISGLFKSTSVNSMFNDVWRMPIDEIDRAGSFASHMSRCVHLLMELLRAQKDYAYLLKLSIFLKKTPENKEKKYLRDNERADLSGQALILCLAAMRECANEIRSIDSVVELFKTVKDGIKEVSSKEVVFKNLLRDAYSTYRKLGGVQTTEDLSYEEAADFCQKELNLRKAAAEARAKSQAAQAQLQAQALQVQVQAQAHIQAQSQAQLQAHVQSQVQPQTVSMEVNTMASTLPFNSLAPRFPAGISAPMRGNSLPSSMFLPRHPVQRGRGRPPKALQRLHSPMVNTAHMIGLGNNSALVTGASNTTKHKHMKHQQKQRQVQQQAASTPNPVVTSIIKDRPALSITTLPNVATMSSVTTTSRTPSMGANSVTQGQGLSLAQALASGQDGWPTRPKQSFPRPLNSHVLVAPNPQGNFSLSNSSRLHGVPRPKSTPKNLPGASVGAHSIHSQPPRPFIQQSQAKIPLNDPAAILSRLPGLQVQQRSQPQIVMTTTQQQGYGATPKSKDTLNPRLHQQPIDRLQKSQVQSIQLSKPALSISKTSSSVTFSGQGNGGASESKKSKDPNYDVITLD